MEEKRKYWRFDGIRLIAPDEQSWRAVSGPYGKGGIPDGLYRIGEAVVIESNHPQNKPYRDSQGLAWWCPLEPLFETERDGLGIHPDGNIPGTSGCIGICTDDTKALLELLRKAEGDILMVKGPGQD